MTGAALETRTCRIELDPKGFVRATILEGIVMELEDARENVACTGELGGGVKRPVLVDARGLKYQSKGARAFFVGPEAERVTRCVALLVCSPVSRMLGNFFLRQQTHPTPTRLFMDEAEAVAWLLSFPA